MVYSKESNTFKISALLFNGIIRPLQARILHCGTAVTILLESFRAIILIGGTSPVMSSSGPRLLGWHQLPQQQQAVTISGLNEEDILVFSGIYWGFHFLEWYMVLIPQQC